MSSTPGVGTILPWEWSNNAAGPAPYAYEVPASLEVQPYTATAFFDGSGAAGAFYPTISIYSQSGALLARVFPNTSIAEGDSATVTWVPPFGSAASSPAPSGSGIQFDTSPQSGDWLDIETTGTDASGLGVNIADTGGGVSIGSTGGPLTLGGVQTGSSGYGVQVASDGGLIDVYNIGDIRIETHGGELTLFTLQNTVVLSGADTSVTITCGIEAMIKAMREFGTPKLGFFGTAPAAQPASGGTLAGVIAGLVALGLFSS
jgi:hypothetical protein